MKRFITSILFGVFLGIFIIPIFIYGYNKTIGYRKTDCMIEYIQKYYPKGSTYLVFNQYPHIDNVGAENRFMKKTGDVSGCKISNTDLLTKIVNEPYCYTTLAFESIIGNVNYYNQ